MIIGSVMQKVANEVRSSYRFKLSKSGPFRSVYVSDLFECKFRSEDVRFLLILVSESTSNRVLRKEREDLLVCL